MKSHCYFTLFIALHWLMSAIQFPVAAQDVSQRLELYLRQREQNINFSGVALVTQAGKTLLRKGYGMADFELKTPNSPEYVFRIGSVSKPITAVGILMLHDRGILKLTDSIDGYFANCPDEWKKVTIHHLLNHTSGVPDFFGALEDAPLKETREEIKRVLAENKSTPLKSPPGGKYKYSNFNYMLLGYLIEIVTKQYWEDFLVENIFGPLEMVQTRYDDVWEIVVNRAHGYKIRDGELANIPYDDHSAFAAGGLRSTIDDLNAWHNAFIGGRLVSSELVNLSLQPYVGNYGYGWQVINLFGRRMHNHTGGIGGFSSHLAYYPSEDLLIILLSNVQNENAKGTACDLARIVFGVKPAPVANDVWLQKHNTERCGQEQ